MRYLITAVLFFIPVIVGVFLYWLSGEALERTLGISLITGVSVTIGTVIAVIYFKESIKK